MENLLRKEINKKFNKYQPSQEVLELKQKLTLSLEKKVADLQEKGLDYIDAVYQVMDELGSIDCLIPGNRLVHINSLRLALLKQGLIYSMLFWSLTLPAKLFGINNVYNNFFFLLLFAFLITYCYFYLQKSKRIRSFDKATAYLNYQQAKKHKQLSLLFISFYILITTFFNLRSLFINSAHLGSYEILGIITYLRIALRLTLPFSAFILPILFGLIPKLIIKYEVKPLVSGDDPML